MPFENNEIPVPVAMPVENTIPLLTEGDLFFVDDPVMEELKNKQIQNFWTAVDVDFSNDNLEKVPSEYFESLCRVMNLFVKMDQVINQYLSDLKIPFNESTKRFHHIQMAIEDVHHEVYTQIIKRLGIENVLSQQHFIQESLNFGLDIKLNEEAMYSLAVLEGFHFSFVFAMFLMMRAHGYMTEACKANEFILKDEYLHCAGWLNLLKQKNMTDIHIIEKTVTTSSWIQHNIVDTLPLKPEDRVIMHEILKKFENSFYAMVQEFTGLENCIQHEIDEKLIEPYVASVSIPTRTKFMDSTASGNEYTNSTVVQDFTFLE